MAAAKKADKEAKKPLTKSEIFTQIALDSGLSRKQVSTVFESLNGMITKSLKPRGAGTFNLSGMLKIKVVRKPATKARKGINPFTGEATVFKAKPARNVVKILPLKALKDSV